MQMGMSLCGATHEAPGQLGVRTFRGPGDDVGGGFDGGPALDAQEEGPPPLGVTPDPKGALRAEARPMGIFDAVCPRCENLPSAGRPCARLWVSSHETKACRLNHVALDAHASSHAMARAAEGPEWRRQSTCRTAQTAISRSYAGKGQVPESTVGLVMRA